ncbi:MAG TPA: hypothetical protein DC038_11595 [Clostridiales bacterium]|nr:hypothetical protein [Clostridiales bacterium]
MPTTYAHYCFGHEVLELLDGNIKKIINENITLFNIGLHGPDILFYYKPLKANDISRTGHSLHGMNADLFFENARKIIRSCSDYEGAAAYIAGFICHFMLDSQCHPFIRQKEREKLSHGTIETEFDRLFMLKNNLNPVSFRPTSHIAANSRNARAISWFFDGISEKDVYKALKSMKFYLDFLVSPDQAKRALITAGLRMSGNYDGMSGLVMSFEPVKECIGINGALYRLYTEAIEPASMLIDEYYRNVDTEKELNERFRRNFG